MPTYEYKCDACGNEFEKFQSITAAPIKKCPACGKNKVKRLLGTGAGLIFKGSGFYITDYRSESYKSAAKGESGGNGSSSGGEGKSEGKSDSKAASSDAASSAGNTSTKSESKPAASAKPSSSSPASKKSK